MIGKLITPDRTIEVNVDALKCRIFDDETFGLTITQLPTFSNGSELLFKKEEYIKLLKQLAAIINMSVIPIIDVKD